MYQSQEYYIFFQMKNLQIYDSAKINLMVGSMNQTSATTEATALVIHDQNSRRNGTEGSGSWKSKITFRSTQINGNSASEGASIVHDITYNNIYHIII